MIGDVVEDKIKVFISSECVDEKFKVARRAIKELLLNTGLVKVYVFEDRSGTSVTVEEAYSRKLEECDLCVFLIDSSREITSGVMKEHLRAQQLKKKTIYFFYSRFNDEKNQLQREIEEKNLCTYEIVDKFEDFVNKVFRAVIQDITDLYKHERYLNKDIEFKFEDKKNKNETFQESTEEYTLKEELNKKTTNVSIDLTNGIKKIDESSLRLTINEIKRDIYVCEEIKEDKSNNIDTLCASFLNVVLYRKKLDIGEFENLKQEILKLYNRQKIKSIIEKRLNAIKLYYQGDIKECIKELEKLLLEYPKNMPNWLKNDIAIDLRNMGNIYMTTDNDFKYTIVGQNYLNENDETVYYPVIDRKELAIKNKIVNGLVKEKLESPYTVSFENETEFFENVAMCYYIALVNGSITHLRLTLERIKEILIYLNVKKNSHIVYLQTIKYLLIMQKDKELENFLRIYEQGIDVLNSEDIRTILLEIENVNIEYNKEISYCLILKYFGNYFCDIDYSNIINKMYNKIINWISFGRKIGNLDKYYFEMLLKNIERIDNRKIYDIVMRIFENNKEKYFDNAMKLLTKFDYSIINDMEKEKIWNYLTQIIKNNNLKNNIVELEYAIIVFRKKAKLKNKNRIDEIVCEYMNEFYDTYLLEVKPTNNIIKKYINKCIQNIRKQNLEQGANGVYFGTSSEEFETLRNIIDGEAVKLTSNEILELIDLSIETLEQEKQTISYKNNAIQFIIFLRNKFPSEKFWNKYAKYLYENEVKFLRGKEDVLFWKESKELMKFNLNLLYISLNLKNDKINISLQTTCLNFDERDKITSLVYINGFLKNINYLKLSKNILDYLLFYTIRMSNEIEQDVRFWAMKCLIELSKTKYKDVVIEQLINMMSSSNSTIRISIISRLKEISLPENNKFIDFAIDKAKVDNNFLVRKIAQKYK